MKTRRTLLKITKLALILLTLSGLAVVAARAQWPYPEPPPSFTPDGLVSFDNFGTALAVSGDTLVAGAPGTNLEGAHNGGAAYIFQRQGVEWKETARLLPEPAQANSGFGYAVAINGKTLVVGARYEYNPQGGNGSGAAYVYTQNKGAWGLQARLAPGDGAPFDLFGYSLALQGDILAVGARAADGPQGERNSGAVYLYQRDGDTWSLQARLSPGDLAAEDHFGQELALNDQYLFASAPSHDLPQAPNCGVVYVYRRQGQGWSQVGQLAPDQPRAGAQFGSALSLEGNTLASLASQEYQEGEPPPMAGLYESADFGVAYLFELQKGVWRSQARLAPKSQEDYSLQLYGAALGSGPGGMRLVLGGMGKGVVYRYQKKGNDWVEVPALKPELLPINEGKTVLLSGNQVLFGHRFYDLNNSMGSTGEPKWSAGSVFVLDW